MGEFIFLYLNLWPIQKTSTRFSRHVESSQGGELKRGSSRQSSVGSMPCRGWFCLILRIYSESLFHQECYSHSECPRFPRTPPTCMWVGRASFGRCLECVSDRDCSFTGRGRKKTCRDGVCKTGRDIYLDSLHQ